MPNYMTQKMSSENTESVTYYRAQTSDHVAHGESEAFTSAAIANYAAFNHIDEGSVDVGTYRSGQGIPTGGKTYLI